MTDMSAAQAAQQNNRNRDGKYATKAVDESGATIDSGADLSRLRDENGERKPVGDHWYFIERQNGPDLLVGPYVTAEEAESAVNDSLAADSFCEEDCLDAYTVLDASRVKDADVVYIDRDADESFGDVRVADEDIPADATVHEWDPTPFGQETSNYYLAKRMHDLMDELDREHATVTDGYYPGSLRFSFEHEGIAQDTADKAVADGLLVHLKDGNILHGEPGAWTFDVSDNDRYGDHTTWTSHEINW